VQHYFIYLSNKEDPLLFQFQAHRALVVLVVDWDHQIVYKLPTEDPETFLALFVRYGKPYFGAKQHLIATHVVFHHVFKDGHQRCFVNNIEVNPVIRDYLDSDISVHEGQKTTYLQFVVLIPVSF
jgi:hypothetical protein